MQFLFENVASTPVLLLAVGVPLLSVPQPAKVRVGHGPIIAASLLEGVGHGVPPLMASLTVLIIKERRGLYNPLHKMNTLIFLNEKLQHHKIIRIGVTHKVAKVHRLKFAIEHDRATQVEEQKTNMIKSVQRLGHA